MRKPIRVVRGPAVLAGALVAMAGCAQEQGQASPASTTSSHGSAPSTRATTAGGNGPLAQFDACGIFTAAEREKYDLPKGELPETVGERGDCEWEVRGPSFGAGFTINILRDHGVDEIVGADSAPEPIQVKDRKGVIYTERAGTLCTITFEYGPDQRIDIIGSVGYAQDESITECDVVKKFAKIVEPKLPERN